ncbi:hypothetical protein ARNL5_03533 [Anaerolineae bacterium]|nr:hypothetical protein [Anaerolineae bacterium]CAG0994691.1 hypothetical protein ARNL5_03533 [Anaerolineae bacterium]
MFTDTIHSTMMMTPGRAETPTAIYLEPGEHQHLGGGTYQLRVLSGMGWVTLKGEDIFLSRNDQLVLSGHGEDVLVGSVNGSTLVLEVRQIRA